MAALQTIEQAIVTGDVTTYLMGNDQSDGALYGTRLVNITSPTLIAYTTDALRWKNETMPTDSTLRGTANYLIWLCGVYGAEARALAGGGSVIPIQPNVPTLLPTVFVVTDSSPMPVGGSNLMLTAYIGYNLIVTRNNVPQETIDTGGSYYSWNKTTGLFTIVGAAIGGELISITPVN